MRSISLSSPNTPGPGTPSVPGSPSNSSFTSAAPSPKQPTSPPEPITPPATDEEQPRSPPGETNTPDEASAKIDASSASGEPTPIATTPVDTPITTLAKAGSLSSVPKKKKIIVVEKVENKVPTAEEAAEVRLHERSVVNGG